MPRAVGGLPPVPGVTVQVRWVIWLSGTFGAKLAGVQYGSCELEATPVVQKGRATGTVRPSRSAQIVAVAVPLVPINGLVEANDAMSSRSDAGSVATVRTSASDGPSTQVVVAGFGLLGMVMDPGPLLVKSVIDGGSAPVPSNIGRNWFWPPRVSSNQPDT